MTYTLQQLIQKDAELGRAIFDRGNRESYGVCCGNCRYWKPTHIGETVCSRHTHIDPAKRYRQDWCGDFERDTTTE